MSTKTYLLWPLIFFEFNLDKFTKIVHTISKLTCILDYVFQFNQASLFSKNVVTILQNKTDVPKNNDYYYFLLGTT